ncbi:hypothetical protein CISIN_1g034919mg [Citrus sinensis]|uniref:Uncharacterized protein n=1 Tax=Citrus sinensis TaxID=2711 RepID=A0A067E298_CITSI|nr:hypothetical protein CISIN_1g034919mg [Citrus sinensis]
MGILPTVWTCHYPCPTGKVKFIVTYFVLIWLPSKKEKKRKKKGSLKNSAEVTFDSKENSYGIEITCSKRLLKKGNYHR